MTCFGILLHLRIYFLFALVSSFYFYNWVFRFSRMPPGPTHPQKQQHSLRLCRLALRRSVLFLDQRFPKATALDVVRP